MSTKHKQPIMKAPIKAKGDKNLNEVKISWAGKLFFAGAAAYIAGAGLQKIKLPIKLRGTPEQIKAIIDAVISSKDFQREVSRKGATIDSVVDKLRLRNLSKSRFKQLTGKSFPI